MRRGAHTLTPLERAVRETVARWRMFEGAGRVLVAVSGGPDSVALLYALVRIGSFVPDWPEPMVAHLDHGLRGEASREDAEFVARLANQLGLASTIEWHDVAAEARASGRNLEATAREVRYAFLTRAAIDTGAECVATGHTATDQAETVLMRLARGAGPDGLSGIAPIRRLGQDGPRLVRPLLGVTRGEVEDYCRERGIAFRTDATNEDTRLTRAFTRRELLPRLERIAPGAVRNLARAAALAFDDRDWFEAEVAKVLRVWEVAESGPVRLPADEVAALPAALRRRVLREAVRRVSGDLRRLGAEHVEAIERLLGPGRGARRVVLPFDATVRRSRRWLVFDRAVENGSGGS